MRIPLFLFLIFSFLCLAFAQENLNKDLKNLKNTIEEFKTTLNEGKGEEICKFWTEDAIFMPEGFEIVKGKEEVCRIWTKNIEGGFRTKDHNTIELTISGDLGLEVVNQLWTMHKEGRKDEWYSSKYVHIWKKQKDGSWKLHIDIWNSNP